MSETEAPRGTDDVEVESEFNEDEADQIVAEASKEQLAVAEAEIDRQVAAGTITNGHDRVKALANLLVEIDEAEASREVKMRLGLIDKNIAQGIKAVEQGNLEQRRDMYPEWWDEYREQVAAGKIKPTQTGRILFFLKKGMLVKDVSKMLNVRYQIVYQVASFNELAGPQEGTPTCNICGRPLTQPNSTARGTGPVCAKGGKHK